MKRTLSLAVFASLIATAVSAGQGVWTPIGPVGGGPTLFAPDPTDARVLYAALPAARNPDGETAIWRSADAGVTWSAANHGLEGERVVALAVDPEQPARLFAVAAPQGCESDDPGGIYRSLNAGRTWQRVASASLVALGCSSAIAFTQGAVLVGSDSGVARSTDGGTAWSTVSFPITAGSVFALAIGESPRHLFAVTPAGLFESRDGGRQWDGESDGLASAFISPEALAVAPSRRTTLYLLSVDKELARSDDGGRTWRDLPGVPLLPYLRAGLFVDPLNANTVFAYSTVGVLRSRDGGETFQRLRGGLPPPSPGIDIRTTVHAMAADAGLRILVGAYNGAWASRDGGEHWLALPLRGIHDNPIRFLQTDAGGRGEIAFASFDDLFASAPGGKIESMQPPVRGQVLDLSLARDRPAHLLAVRSFVANGTDHRFAESVSTGSRVSLPTPNHPYAVTATSDGTLFLASGSRVFRRAPGDAPWRQVFAAIPQGDFLGIVGFAIHPRRPTTLLAVASETRLHQGSYTVLFASVDGGSSWRRLPAAGDLPYQAYNVFAFDPQRPNLLIAASHHDLFEVGLDRPSATPVGSHPAGFSALAVDREDSRTLFAVTPNGLAQVSHDRGETWSKLGNAFPAFDPNRAAAIVQDSASPRRLYFGGSSGLWELDLPER